MIAVLCMVVLLLCGVPTLDSAVATVRCNHCYLFLWTCCASTWFVGAVLGCGGQRMQRFDGVSLCQIPATQALTVARAASRAWATVVTPVRLVATSLRAPSEQCCVLPLRSFATAAASGKSRAGEVVPCRDGATPVV